MERTTLQLAHPHAAGQTKERQREGLGSEACNYPRVPHNGDNQTVNILKYQNIIINIKRKTKPSQEGKEKPKEQQKVKEKYKILEL